MTQPSGPGHMLKWRPRLALVLALVIGTVVTLPLAGLFFFRIYDNQLIRQTEGELVAQTAVLAAMRRRRPMGSLKRS